MEEAEWAFNSQAVRIGHLNKIHKSSKYNYFIMLFLLNPQYWRAVKKRVYHGSTTYSRILSTVAFSGFSLRYRATDIPRSYLGTNSLGLLPYCGLRSSTCHAL